MRIKKPWLKEDVQDLRKMVRAGIPASRIARLFRRTEGALRQKAMNIGVRFRKTA